MTSDNKDHLGQNNRKDSHYNLITSDGLADLDLMPIRLGLYSATFRKMDSLYFLRRKVFLLDSRFSFLWAIRAPSRIFAEQPDGWMGSNFCLRHVGTYISFFAYGLPILTTARCY